MSMSRSFAARKASARAGERVNRAALWEMARSGKRIRVKPPGTTQLAVLGCRTWLIAKSHSGKRGAQLSIDS